MCKQNAKNNGRIGSYVLTSKVKYIAEHVESALSFLDSKFTL